MKKELKEILEDIYRYRSLIITAGITIAITLCLTSSKGTTMVMGFFTALTAFIGVAYAQDKQNVFLNKQLEESKNRQDEKIEAESKQKDKEYRQLKEEEFYISLLTYRHYLLTFTSLRRDKFYSLIKNELKRKTELLEKLDDVILKMRSNFYKVKVLQAKFNFSDESAFSEFSTKTTKITSELLSFIEDEINTHKDEVYEYKLDIINNGYVEIGNVFKEISDLIETMLAKSKIF